MIKAWKLAALIAGMLVVPLVIRRCLKEPLDERDQMDRRYAIDDLIADQPIS